MWTYTDYCSERGYIIKRLAWYYSTQLCIVIDDEILVRQDYDTPILLRNMVDIEILSIKFGILTLKLFHNYILIR